MTTQQPSGIVYNTYYIVLCINTVLCIVGPWRVRPFNRLDTAVQLGLRNAGGCRPVAVGETAFYFKSREPSLATETTIQVLRNASRPPPVLIFVFIASLTSET